MGAAEAAEALGVATPNLRITAGLPKPVQTLRCGPIFRASDVNELARKRQRKRVAK